jgi:hypothetical protein
MPSWWDQRPLDRDTRRWERQAVYLGATILNAEITSSISIQGVPTARRSLPGEPPRMETHDLIRSWQVGVHPAGVSWIGYTFSNAGYSYILEVGAPSINLEARPYIVRALLARSGDIAVAMTQPL